MNNEQERWAKRLQKCIKEMPSGIELIVSADASSSAAFLILPEGKAHEMECQETDRFHVDFGAHALKIFVGDRVIANSESI